MGVVETTTALKITAGKRRFERIRGCGRLFCTRNKMEKEEAGRERFIDVESAPSAPSEKPKNQSR